MIPGTLPMFGNGSAKSAAFQSVQSSTSNLTSYTFTNVPLGYYDPTRIIVIGVSWYKFDTASALNSASVGGVTTTQRASDIRLVSSGSGSYEYCSLRTAAPTGDTGTISLSFSTPVTFGVVVGVWALYNVSSAVPVSTDDISSSGGGWNYPALSGVPGDIVIAMGSSAFDGTNTTWTGATENYDTVTSRMLSSGAQYEMTTTGLPPISFSMNNSSFNPVGCAGIWR